MGLFTKKKNDELNNNENEQEFEDNGVADNIKPVEDEWIWVEGYKGTDKEMRCRDTQYELNKLFTYEDNIELCESGYHFCKELKNVFRYYSLDNGNRFFKVKCLVTKAHWESGDDKFTSKEITFTEELNYDELESFILEKYYFVNNKEDWNKMNTIGIKKYFREYFMRTMINSGYGETFSIILFDDINKKIENAEEERRMQYIQANSYSGVYSSGRYVTRPQQYYIYNPSYDYSRFEKLLTKVKALKEEGISKDMSVYLLLQK